MPRQLPDYHREFRDVARKSTDLVASVETVLARGKPPELVTRQLTPPRVCMVYEAAYLQIFSAWETVLEETFVGFLCGWKTTSWIPTPLGGPSANLQGARQRLLSGRPYVLWYPKGTIERAGAHFGLDPSVRHAAVVTSALQELEWWSAIRHRIAHSTSHAQSQFEDATMGLSGRKFATPGDFLRSIRRDAYPAETWLARAAWRLGTLSKQMVS